MDRGPHVRTSKTYIALCCPSAFDWLKTEFDSSSFSVYLNVTNVETFGVEHDKFCIKWTPHRAATSYRIKLNPVDRKSFALPAVAAPPSGCRAAVSLNLSWQILIEDDVEMNLHLSATPPLIPTHMEVMYRI